MAYTLPQFIAQAQAGGAVKVKTSGGSNSIRINGTALTLTAVDTDLGGLFTATNVLECTDLRQGITAGNFIADAGTLILTKEVI